LALVGIIKDAPDRSGGEWIMRVLKELVYPITSRSRLLLLLTYSPVETQLSNDPSLSSLPLLTTFLKSYSRPYLAITPPQSSKATTEGDPTSDGTEDTEKAIPQTEEFVEKDIRDRFKRMCEGYFQNVSKKLVIEHNVCGIKVTMRRVTHT
jgi:regulator of nonsense transcripts 2